MDGGESWPSSARSDLDALQVAILARLAVWPQRWERLAEHCSRGTTARHLSDELDELLHRELVTVDHGTKWDRLWRITDAGRAAIARADCPTCKGSGWASA